MAPTSAPVSSCVPTGAPGLDGEDRRRLRVGKLRGAIRELTLDEHGPRVAPPLEQFTGVLTGVPRYVGVSEQLSDS